VVATFGWLGARVWWGPYLPSSAISDGVGYFMGARSFYLNHSLRAPIVHLDKVSLIGEFYSHGFAYSLINGGAGLVVGWRDDLIIAVNVVLLGIATLFILTRRYGWPWRLALLLLLLTFYLTPTMTFAYMQETVHLLFALTLGHLLMRIVAGEQTRQDRRLVVWYCLFVALLALVRPTWVLWAAGLFAVAGSRRDRLLAASLFGLGFVYQQLFFAPYPYYTPYAETVAALQEHRFGDAAHAFARFLGQNAAKLFSDQFYIFGTTFIPNACTGGVIVLTAYLYWRYRFRGDRPALAVALIATGYDVRAGARIVAVVFILQLVYLVRTKKRATIAVLVVIQLATFPAVVGMTGRIIGAQASAGEYAVHHRAQLQTVRDLGSAINMGRRATIYVDNALSN
jgi:hypothetical protein